MLKKFLVYLILLSLPLVFASNDVSVSLVTSGNDIWTRASTGETFNFTIINQDSSFSFNIVNITVPDDFSFSENLNNSLDSTWVCSEDSSEISCYNEIDLLLENGGSINIWFNVTSVVSVDEENVTWEVILVNETTVGNILIKVNSSIDGKPPQVNKINMSYDGSVLGNGGDITERKNITLIVNVTDGGIGIDQVLAHVNNSFGIVVSTIILSQGDSVFIGEIDTSSLVSGNYTIYIEVNDSFGNLNDSETKTFRIVDPDFEITDFWWIPDNPYPEEKLTVFANITNSGEVDYTGDVTLKWSNGTDGRTQIIESGFFINETKDVNYTFENFVGQNTINLTIDPEDSILELSEDNNYYSQNISTNLNIT